MHEFHLVAPVLESDLHGGLSCFLVRRSVRVGEGHPCLTRGLLGLAAHTLSAAQLVPQPHLPRLSQARGHLRSGQVFLHRVHLGFSGSGSVFREVLLRV
jgi:hypothetical protein